MPFTVDLPRVNRTSTSAQSSGPNSSEQPRIASKLGSRISLSTSENVPQSRKGVRPNFSMDYKREDMPCSTQSNVVGEKVIEDDRGLRGTPDRFYDSKSFDFRKKLHQAFNSYSRSAYEMSQRIVETHTANDTVAQFLYTLRGFGLVTPRSDSTFYSMKKDETTAQRNQPVYRCSSNNDTDYDDGDIGTRYEDKHKVFSSRNKSSPEYTCYEGMGQQNISKISSDRFKFSPESLRHQVSLTPRTISAEISMDVLKIIMDILKDVKEHASCEASMYVFFRYINIPISL